MEDYKINALNGFFASKGLSHRFASSSTVSYKLITINNIPVYARLANTPQAVEKGLMGVEKLAENEGCLLCFSYDAPANLWMKNCKVNLQAVGITKAGEIVDILNMSHKDPYYIHKTSQSVRYVLEMSEGFFTKNNIKVGDKIRL